MKQRPNHYLAAILILSVLLRVAVAAYLGDEVDAPSLLTDQRSYDALGARLIAGHGFSFDRAWYPFTPAEAPTAHWSFLYSLFVAGVYALFGVHPLAVRLIQAILGGLLLPWMIYRLARHLFSPPLPLSLLLLAALMASLYGYFILYAATLMTETFYITAVLWSLERGLKLADRLRVKAAMRALWPLVSSLGLSLGVATLLRQSILPWVPVLFIYLFWTGWRVRWLRSTVAAVGIVVLILTVFNSNAGYAMYSAQHPMHGTDFREFDPAPLPEGLRGQPEPELDRALMRQGIQFILDDPGRYLLLSLSRARAFFEFWPTPDTTLLHNIGRTGSFGLFLPFMLYGLILAVRRRQFVAHNALLFLFAAFYTLLHMLTWAMVRYRLPVDAIVIPLTALAVADLVQRVREATRHLATGY